MNTDVYPSFEALPDRHRGLLAKAAAGDFFLSAPWFTNQFQTTGRPGDALRIYTAETESGPAAILILRALAAPQGALGLRMLSSCSSIYSTFFGPVLAPSDTAGAGLKAIARRISGERPRFDAVRIDSLDRDSAAFAWLVQGFREAGMLVQPFFHFGNWYEDIQSQSLDDYLKRRSSQQRYQIRHRSRKLMQSGRARFELVTGGPALEAAIGDYERVYAGSWKVPEPFPLFTAGLVRAAAAAGVLRMGFLRVDGEPAAAQIWIVGGGRATIFKLVFVEKFRDLNAGTVLTHELLRHVIEVDHVREIDYGHGDDEYKKRWMSRRRERWGIMAFNMRSFRGWIAGLCNIGGSAARRALRGIQDQIRGQPGATETS